MRRLFPLLLIAAAMVGIAAVRWADPFWPVCWVCLMQAYDKAAAAGYTYCTPLDRITLVCKR